MRVISIRQPYALLIILGHKFYETRDWPTSYRGTILVHAAKTFGWSENKIATSHPIREALEPYQPLTLGALIGFVDIIDCFPTSNLTPFPKSQEAFADFSRQYVWTLANPKRLARPHYFKGQLGFWEVHDDTAKKLLATTDKTLSSHRQAHVSSCISRSPAHGRNTL
jgi:hypothetical protein